MMRHGNLWDAIVSFENLHAAYRSAIRNKRYSASAAAFSAELDENLLALRDELRSGSYEPGPYRTFTIYEPKQRLISAAPFRDRVVHHALCNAIQPIFERSFIHDSYATRLGKGTHAAVLRFSEFQRRFAYVLKLDVEKYFPSIDHSILKSLLRRKIKCPGTLGLRLIAKASKIRVFSCRENIGFLGYRCLPTHRRLERGNVLRALSRLRSLERALADRRIGVPDYRASLMSWLGHVKWANAKGLIVDTGICREG